MILNVLNVRMILSLNIWIVVFNVWLTVDLVTLVITTVALVNLVLETAFNARVEINVSNVILVLNLIM